MPHTSKSPLAAAPAETTRRRTEKKAILPLRPSRGRAKPVIMVCSTVYGQERLLERIYRALTACGYEVIMSHQGHIRVDPRLSATDTCLRAVEEADGLVFLFTTHYGSSGKVGKSITHKELDHAIAHGKLIWALAHHDLIAAREIGKKLARVSSLVPLKGHPPKAGKRGKAHLLALREMGLVQDHCAIAMYEKACRMDVKRYKDRVGNWVQTYHSVEDALRFLDAQFAPRHTA